MAQVHRSASKRLSAGLLLVKKVEESGGYGLGEVIDDGEFPHHLGVIDGVKCCTKCGATKTPQWREGPYGPKTLCNACGVKRTRKLRAEQEGQKRRRVSTSKQKKKSAQLEPMESLVPMKEEDGKTFQMQHQHSMTMSADLADMHVNHSSGRPRPTRKAAEEAAYRTARYARTGEWGHLNSPAVTKKTMFKFDLAGNPTTGSNSSSDNMSAPLSDTHEEIAWAPAAENGMFTPDCTARTSDDCFAAINLMTMSAKSSLDDTFFSHPMVKMPSEHETPESSPSKVSLMQPSNSEVEMALSKAAELTGGLLIESNISKMSQSVPPGKVSELIKLTETLSSAQHDVQVAEASVSAMAAMLAANQAALLQKQYQVNTTTDQLRRFVYELEHQFGLTYKVLPRIRVSNLPQCTLKHAKSI